MITKLLVHATFPCDRCGVESNRLAVVAAHCDAGGNMVVDGDPEQPAGEIVCNECHRKELELERSEFKRSSEQRRWASKAVRRWKVSVAEWPKSPVRWIEGSNRSSGTTPLSEALPSS